MTPSAARGVLEAIFWKPEFLWQVREIHVLNPIRHFSLLRNEVSSRMSPRSPGLDITECRTQRHTLGLQNVAYLIVADAVVQPGVAQDAAKYRDQFRRRVERGQCYHRPYLGCREFPAHFEMIEGDMPPSFYQGGDAFLGWMLHDIDFDDKMTAHFFRARMVNGRIAVPPLKGGGAP
jgi:CRISPR-associated protein Cas5d